MSTIFWAHIKNSGLFSHMMLFYILGGGNMATPESVKRAVSKYQKEKLEEIKFRVPKGNKERIQNHAKANGESTNAFIYRAINETIEREAKK